jgi:hypothetical protein
MLLLLSLLVLAGTPAFAVKPDSTPPITTATPAGGTYETAQSVTLSVNEPATTYYTTDGSTPTTSSTVYSSPINIAVTTTLKFFSRDTAGNSETPKTALYTIGSPTLTHDPNNTSLTWTGYGMCKDCHRVQAQDMYQSVHYQWKSAATGMTTGPATQGKLDATDGSSAMNAYCINIQGNWNPCGSCHIGTGAKPVATTNPTDAQLASVDCLMCHSQTYSRVRNATTGLFEPAAGLDMDNVVRSVGKPTRKNCLGCHAKAGGGDAVKRGDIALATITNSDFNYDMHMVTLGADLPCQACHTFTAHKVAGRGTDLRPSDSTVPVNCSTSSCHPTKSTATGHTTADVNRHVARVACQSCHIKQYARGFLTETSRTWEHSEWNSVLGRWEPTPTKAGNLTPKYAFWNGTTAWGNNAFDAAVLDPVTGAYKISRPVGAITGATDKLFPFKYKTARQPLANGKLVTLSTATYFNSGSYDQATKDGLVYMGMSSSTPYQTVTTDEYQLLNHQVQPKAQALTCSDCHEATAPQMKLVSELGYALKGPVAVVCSQCHNVKTPGSYTRIHSHTINKGKDCSWCHTFSRPERGYEMP